jgi:hypothetical protein
MKIQDGVLRAYKHAHNGMRFLATGVQLRHPLPFYITTRHVMNSEVGVLAFTRLAWGSSVYRHKLAWRTDSHPKQDNQQALNMTSVLLFWQVMCSHMKITVFRDVMSRNLVDIYRCFSEMSVNMYLTTRCHIPEDSGVHILWYENLNLAGYLYVGPCSNFNLFSVVYCKLVVSFSRVLTNKLHEIFLCFLFRRFAMNTTVRCGNSSVYAKTIWNKFPECL